MADTPTLVLNRRQFLAVGAGLCFSFVLPTPSIAGNSTKASEVMLNAWVRITHDNNIIIYSPAAEMGQGSLTSIPMIFAEELDADWDNVRIEVSPTNNEHFKNPTPWVYGVMLTLGSSAVSGYYNSVRLLGAQARAVLLRAAARHWQVNISSLSTKPSRVVHTTTGRQISYGDLAALVNVNEPVPKVTEASLKSEENFRIIGADLPRCDLPEKVNGSAQYSIDVDLPHMVYATVLHSPVNGAKVLGIKNLAEIKKRPHIIDVIILPGAVAVVANRYEAALNAEPYLQVEWSTVKKLQDFSDQQALRNLLSLVRDDDVKGFVVQEIGNVEQALKSAVKVWEREYFCDFVYHGQIEPLNAVASVNSTDKTVTLWAGTQAPTYCVRAVADELGINKKQVTLHRMYLGGSFGRRGAQDHDYVVDAVRLSKRLQLPVKVIWTRTTDVRAGRFKPIKAISLRVAQDAEGKLVGWAHRTASDEPLKQSDPNRYSLSGGWPGISGSGLSIDYDIEHVKAEMIDPDIGVRMAPLRGVGATANKFAAESIIDEIALAQNEDPLKLRMALLNKHSVAQKVLTTVAQMSGWYGRKEGSGMGLAFDSTDYPTAYVVQVKLAKSSGIITVSKVWVALDVGVAIHPKNIASQIEGQIIYAISNTLKERITMTKGKVEQSNFFDYPILRINEIPDIEIKLLTRRGSKPSGVGDSRLATIPAAVANAFADLTGKRLRHMPFIPKRVSSVLG